MRALSFSSSSSAPTTTTSTTTTTKRFWRQNRIGRKTVERRRRRATTREEEEEEEEKNEKNNEKSYSPPSIIVVVEGINDAKRVRKALNVSHPNAVFAMRGSYFDAKANRWKIQANVVKTVERNAGWLLIGKEREEAEKEKEAEIVVFTDPDVAGRQYRQNFIQYLPRAKHAFVSRYRARCKKKTRWHEVNDCGVEFATDGAIRVAVKEARAPRIVNSKGTSDVVEWMTMREIEQRGLKGAAAGAEEKEEEKETTAASSTVGVSSKRLRHVLGNVLGIGECDARQLQRQLNMFFTSEEFEVAMETALELIESGKADECDFSSSSSSSSEDERDEEEDFGFDPNAYVPPGQAPPGFD
jgi:ribonuclease M5